MAEKKAAGKPARAKGTQKAGGFTDEERAAMRERAREMKAEAEAADGESAVLAKLARRGDIDPDERVVAYITGEGLKTLDAVRGTFSVREIDPTIEAFEASDEPIAAFA